MVRALHAVRTWRGERLHERQSGPEFAKTFVVFPGKDQTQSDVSPKSQTDTHASMQLHPHLCTPLPIACVKLSVKRMSLLGTKCLSVFLLM